jgi:tetraacyldisaccharide 4'-kinase
VTEWVERLFYPSGPEGPLRQLLLSPLSAAELGFRVGVSLRGLAYDRGWVEVEAVSGLSILSVGNLTVGGAGKTPVVRALAERLLGAGERVAVLSRGWGRRSEEELRVVGPLWPSVDLCGDEPLMLARSLPAAQVWVGADRAKLARRAVELGATAAILDDGFQHRRLGRALDIVVVDEGVGLGNGHLLPRGPLREPPEALSRARLLWVRASERPVPIPWPAGVPQVRARHAPSELLSPDGSARAPAVLGGRAVVAFCGLARPSNFRRTLETLGAELRGFHPFADHHRFSAAELSALERAAADAGAWLVTTEKDAVRCPEGFGVHVLRLGVEVVEGEPTLAALLEAARTGAPGRAV